MKTQSDTVVVTLAILAPRADVNQTHRALAGGPRQSEAGIGGQTGRPRWAPTSRSASVRPVRARSGHRLSRSGQLVRGRLKGWHCHGVRGALRALPIFDLPRARSMPFGTLDGFLRAISRS